MTPLTFLRILTISEGCSYLALGITMPLKYVMKWPEPNYFVGMLHGVLFIGYVLMVFIYGYKNQKSNDFFAAGWLTSIIPFGTFWFDYKYLRENQQIEKH